MKFILCDLQDKQYDSAVFIKTQSLSNCVHQQVQIYCPTNTNTQPIEICPNAAFPQAFAQGNCEQNLTVSWFLSEDHEDAKFGVIYYVNEYPNVTCSFDVVERSRDPIVYTKPGTFLITYVRNDSVMYWDGVSSGNSTPVFQIGDVLNLTFSIDSDCCIQGNSGVIKIIPDHNGNSIVLREWNETLMISVSIPIVKEFGNFGFDILIELVNCENQVSVKWIQVQVECNDVIITPVVIVEGGMLEMEYEVDDSIRFFIRVPQFNVGLDVLSDGKLVESFAPVVNESLAKIYTYTVSDYGEVELDFVFTNECGTSNIVQFVLNVKEKPTESAIPTESELPTESEVPTEIAYPECESEDEYPDYHGFHHHIFHDHYHHDHPEYDGYYPDYENIQGWNELFH
eukprot:CAMPEP_0182441838 /NCGR_PEP_ID=MMETSP1172-20130603/835_1 /TAXON_ID=708627 /ORGANISM="Timspurckia oligopyrenoides, Strain CCMP3278" /LENGTH=397 /DNA_ID=CAMNT_0024636403 /DNA_START=2236 /DNA_END=3429 /DNA_ORIENTATION=-